MPLARSGSTPGGLSINTGVANSQSSSRAQPPAPGGLFGFSSTSAKPTTSKLGGMATAGSLFGNTQPKPSTGGLFGSSTTTAAAPSQSGTTGGLFGAATNKTQTPQAGAASGGLFGGAVSQQSTQKPAGGGLFGANATAQPSQQQPQQTSGSLFGASTTNRQTSNAGGLFGQTQSKPSSGLFGQTQPQQVQSAPQIPAVQINYDNLRPRTRFDDLAKPIQDEIALIDRGIQRVMKMKDEIGEFMPQHERDIEQLGKDVKFVETKFKTVQVALNRDIQTVKVLQDLTKKSIADAQLSFKATDNLKLPTHYHQTGLFAGPPPSADSNGSDSVSAHTSAQDLISYFNRICDDVERYKKRLDEYRTEIERDMPGVENGLYEQIRTLRDRHSARAGRGAVQDQLTQILAALRETGSAIIAQAGQIADTRERLSRLQAGIVDSGVYAMGTTS